MLAEGEISQSEMNLISQASADQNELSKILRKLLKDGRLRRCLQRLPEFLDSIPGENVENTVLSIFNISDKISRKRGGDFDFGVEWDIYRFAYHMLKKIPSENRYVALENILKESKSVDSPIHLISIGEDEHKKGKGEDLLSIEELQKIIPIALTKIKLYAEKRKLDSSPGFAYILYRWKRWGDEKEVKSYINELFKSPQGIATFIKGFISERSESSRNKHWVSYKDMKDFIDLDILKTKINQIESKEKQLLSAEDQEYINSYLYRVDKAIEGNDSIFD